MQIFSTNLASFKLSAANATLATFQQALKEDHHRYFRINSYLDKRKMPVYTLVVTNRKKAAALKSRGGKPRYDWDTVPEKARKYPGLAG